MSKKELTIAVIGGTGGLGSALALRWSQAGYNIFIGSRNKGKANLAADNLNKILGNKTAFGLSNSEAANSAEIIVLAVPFSNHKKIIEEISEAAQGKIVVDTTVPLMPPKVARVQLPPEGSAGLITQQLLGENVRVVSAFQNIAADSLPGDAPITCDVLVTGDSKDAREAVIQIARASGMRAWHAGPLANSVAAEAMTSLLIHLNKQFPGAHTGIKITGIPD